MRYVKKHAKSASKRSLSLFLSLMLFVTLFVGTLSTILTGATNPTHTGALNTHVPVEYINLKPVVPGKTSYVDDEGSTVNNVDSRTNYGAAEYADYLNVAVQSDESVRYSMKQTRPSQSASDTTYLFTHTQVNQMVNLQQNPYFMLAWEANCRVNGSINFTITKGNKSYYINTNGDTNDANDTIHEVPSGKKEITPNDTTYRYSNFSFYQIQQGRYTSSSNNAQNDFAVLSRADYTVDLYAYLYQYFKNHDWLGYWPDWSSGDYLTINYVTHTMVSEGINTPLYDYSYVKWTTCGVGRLALNQYSTLTPRVEGVVNYGHYNANGDIVYDETPGRSSRLDDGTYVFRNTSETQQAIFRWDVKRYVNINELQALYLDAELTNTDSDFEMRFALLGRNLTTNSHTKYTTEGYWATLSDLMANHSDQSNTALSEKYNNVTIDLNEEILEHTQADANYYPSDHMICIREIELYLPPNAKLAINKFSVKIENEFAPSTTSDTVYPWATGNEVENLPPMGTPATSDTLDPSTGANSAAYNWAATSTPIVENKVDLLAMTDQHVLYDSTGKFTGYEQDDVTGYWRTLEGKSHFTSKSSDIVYRAFRRRDKTVVESNTRDNSNYYMEIPVSTTPYLYYSYTLEGGDDKAVGLYFNFTNANQVLDAYGNPHVYNHYYLGQSGLALSQCDGIMTSTSDSVADAHRALCSSADARTGVIDLRSIGYKDGDIAKILDMRFYLTGTSTEATFDYLFFGSETLDESATDTIAKNSGDAFPWSITHDQFKAATLGTDAEFTFANRLDLIDDMIDRKIWALKAGTYNAGDEYNAFGSAFRYNNDGSITVSATSNQRYVQVGTSFDHMLAFTINKSDLASLRYINYSVEAQPGMRWSILLRESTSDGTTDYPAVALRTWSDAMMTGDFYGTGSTNAADSKATVGKSYFREMRANTFQNNWFNGAQASSNAEDEAWAMFTVPGSETGCFDLSQIQTDMSWDSVISIYFIVYRDPSLMTEDGSASVGGSVTFNYAYLTSEPLKGDSFGTASLTSGSTYSWGYDADPLTGDARNVKFTGNPTSQFHTASNANTGTWAMDFLQDSAGTQLNLTSYHKSDYSLYYSFAFTDKQGNEAYPKFMIGFMDSNNSYVLQCRRSSLGTTGLYTGNIDDLRGVYRHQMPQSGSVRISSLGLNNIKRVRVYYDATKYNIHVQYVVVAWSHDYSASAAAGYGGLPSQTKKLTSYSGKIADFSDDRYVTDTGIKKVVTNVGGTTFTGNYNTSKSIEVDLNRTPYLFYSIKYDKGASGTFALATDISIAGQTGFYRDGTEAELRSQNLLRPGISPTAAFYMPESETGCIDVRSWLQRQNALPSNGIITINRLYVYLTGGNAHYYYMYFGAEADKTIDLLPAVAQGDLENGVSTHAAVTETNKMFELHQIGETTADGEKIDSYILESGAGAASATVPSMVSYLPGDRNEDGYNDLTYSNTTWGYYNMCYGQIQFPHGGGYTYISTGNNQMSGLTINLNETPYLHFSISQPSDSLTTFILQMNGETGRSVVRDLTAENVRPWLSCYNTQSPAGQLMHISPQTSYISYYKDTVMEYTNGTYVSGDFAGVIDLRSWFTETNGFDDIVSLERVRFYSPDPKVAKKTADVTVNHFYLSSSCGSAYSVTFDKNDGSDLKQTIQILKNANDQYVSDQVPTDLGYKEREGYTFVGWYLDPDWEQYFDIENTPIRENLRLYAGWLNNDDVVDGVELDLIARANQDQSIAANKVTTSGTGHWETDSEALHIRNTGNTDYTITVPINKAYSLYDSRALYLGMDTAKSMQAMVDVTDETRTSDGARIVLDLKSLGSHKYDLIGADFGSYFLTENNILTAAPYNEQLPMYMHIANKDLLPVKENTNGYVYAKSITFTIPVGCAMHIRYATAAKSMDEALSSVVAPEITGTVLDLLDPKGDEGYVEQLNNTTYELLEEQTEIYNRTAAPTGLMQAHITGVNSGYATLGSLYGLGNTLGEVPIDVNNQQYLYYNFTQNDESSTTFNIWCTIYYEGTGESGTIHPPKWSSHFDARDGSLHSQDDLVGGSIARAAFATGSHTGRINLYEWYSDAIQSAINRGEIPADSKVTKVRITGVRLYTANSGTDVTFNYLAIGGMDNTDENLRAKATVVNAEGHVVQDTISDVNFGQIVKISLDQLRNSADATDPTKLFRGWSFTSASSEPVWWNPNATNDKKYDASTNTGGVWSPTQVNGFVQNRRDISYQLTDETKMLYPVFASATSPKLTVKFSGNGSVDVLRDTTKSTISSQTSTSETFGRSLVLSAVGNNFIGWYGENDQLLTSAKDYAFAIFNDTVVTAKFGAEGPAVMKPFEMPEDSHSIIWLQRADEGAGVAGNMDNGFYLLSVNSGNIVGDSVAFSNINDVGGEQEIICYWSVEDGQLLEAVAPNGYHWEMYLHDGSTVCLGNGKNTYRFISSLDIKLICTPNSSTSCTEATGVIVNEYAVAFDRSPQTHTARVSGQVFTAENEMIVDCGFVMASRPSRVQVPSYNSPESSVYAAQAWNSTTGQFTVNVDYTRGMAYFIRGYAVVKNLETQEYTLRYSDYTTISF